MLWRLPFSQPISDQKKERNKQLQERAWQRTKSDHLRSRTSTPISRINPLRHNPPNPPQNTNPTPTSAIHRDHLNPNHGPTKSRHPQSDAPTSSTRRPNPLQQRHRTASQCCSFGSRVPEQHQSEQRSELGAHTRVLRVAHGRCDCDYRYCLGHDERTSCEAESEPCRLGIG